MPKNHYRFSRQPLKILFIIVTVICAFFVIASQYRYYQLRKAVDFYSTKVQSLKTADEARELVNQLFESLVK